MLINYPNNKEIALMFSAYEQWTLLIAKELLWVLTCLQCGQKIPNDLWQTVYGPQYTQLQLNLQNNKKSFEERNTYFQKFFKVHQKDMDDLVLKFKVNHSIQNDVENLKDFSMCHFEDREDLINRYTILFENKIPQWFLKSLNDSVPEDAMNIYLSISLSVMPQDGDDPEDFTEFEYTFHHEYDYFDSNQIDQEWSLTECYTCKNSEDAHKKICIINKQAVDFSEILIHEDDWFDANHLDRIIQDIDKRDIAKFDRKLLRQICLFEEIKKEEEKQNIATHISQNCKRKEFLNNKNMEWSVERLSFFINHRHTDDFVLRNKRDYSTDVIFFLPDEQNSFLPLLTLMNSLFKTRLSMDDFDKRKKVKCEISWEIIDNMITLKIDFNWSKKLNQVLEYSPFVTIEQLYMIMELFCPKEFGMDYSLEWISE